MWKERMNNRQGRRRKKEEKKDMKLEGGKEGEPQEWKKKNKESE